MCAHGRRGDEREEGGEEEGSEEIQLSWSRGSKGAVMGMGQGKEAEGRWNNRKKRKLCFGRCFLPPCPQAALIVLVTLTQTLRRSQAFFHSSSNSGERTSFDLASRESNSSNTCQKIFQKF